jgi:hypothetical protein
MAEITKYTELNSRIKQWTGTRTEQMKSWIFGHDVMFEGDLHAELRFKIRESFGKAAIISWQFPRHGVFVEKGVGRGNPIGGVGSTNKRKPKPWFQQSVTDASIAELERILGTEYESINVRTIKKTFDDLGTDITMGMKPVTPADVSHLSDYEQALFMKYYYD